MAEIADALKLIMTQRYIADLVQDRAVQLAQDTLEHSNNTEEREVATSIIARKILRDLSPTPPGYIDALIQDRITGLFSFGPTPHRVWPIPPILVPEIDESPRYDPAHWARQAPEQPNDAYRLGEIRRYAKVPRDPLFPDPDEGRHDPPEVKDE